MSGRQDGAWKILLIDEEVENSFILSDLLREGPGHSFVIYHLTRMREIDKVLAYQKSDIDLVIVAYSFGWALWFDMIKILKNSFPDIPYILFTDGTEPDPEVDIQSYGASGLICQDTITPYRLFIMIEQLINSHSGVS